MLKSTSPRRERLSSFHSQELEAILSRRASRASWSGRLLDDASDQYQTPSVSLAPSLRCCVENRPGDDGQGRRCRGWAQRTFLPSITFSFSAIHINSDAAISFLNLYFNIKETKKKGKNLYFFKIISFFRNYFF